PDAAIVYDALLGLSHAAPPKALARGLSLAVLRPYFCDLLDDGVRAQFEAALELLRSAGAQIDEVEIPHARDIASIYLRIAPTEAAAHHAATLEKIPERYTTPVRERLESGR